MSDQRSDHDLLVEIHTDMRNLKETVEGIPAKCAGHSVRLDNIEKSIDGLWARWWWAFSTAVVALCGAVATLAKMAFGGKS